MAANTTATSLGWQVNALTGFGSSGTSDPANQEAVAMIQSPQGKVYKFSSNDMIALR